MSRSTDGFVSCIERSLRLANAAAPATVRATMPEANPSLYLALPLALTFPMNLLLGIPFTVVLLMSLALEIGAKPWHLFSFGT